MFRDNDSLTPKPATAAILQFPPCPPRFQPKPTHLALAFIALQERIADLEPPYEPKYAADVGDLDEWADHLSGVLGAALAYAQAVASHIGDVTSGGIADETGFLDDAIREVVGAIRKGRE